MATHKRAITFTFKKTKNRKTGNISYRWIQVHQNGNKVNHSYNSLSSAQAQLRNFLAIIQQGRFEVKE